MSNEYSVFFNSDMTSIEARHQLFSITQRIPREEYEKLFAAYIEVAEKIWDKEFADADEGWMY